MIPGKNWRSALTGASGGGSGSRGVGAAGGNSTGPGNGQLVSKNGRPTLRMHRLPGSLRAFVCNFLWPLLCLALGTGATGGVKAVPLGDMERNGKVKVHGGVDDGSAASSPLSPVAASSGAASSTDMGDMMTRVYAWRFVQLTLFILYSMTNAFQWIEYSIITNLVMKYYNIDELTVNWTAVVYMVTYIPLIFPASWLLERRGLRFVVILGALGTCAGSWIKVLSVERDRFVVCLVGQTVVAVSQIFILSIPPRLAAVWFSAQEVSRACSFGVFGNQLGIALGFLIPPQVVTGSPDTADGLEEIGRGLTFLCYGVAIFSSVVLIGILFGFRDKPPRPPSRAQVSREQADPTGYWHSMRNLLRNANYMLLLITYGINVGTFYAISTLLNQVFLTYFKGQETTAGWLGLSLVISGMVGSVLCGIVLDETHRYKETTLVVYVFSLAGMVAYTYVLDTAMLWPVFFVTCLLGFFMTGYLPLGFEFAAEVTYPEPEGTSSGLLNASAQVFGILFTMVAGKMLVVYGDRTTNLALSGALLVGSILTALIRSDLRRRHAQLQSEPSAIVST
ncbi:feline leukemia virus subgroup C receptor-related protein 1 [Rhipicephalus sanguineus]|uniref:feline leukemia virus subgroup C receptor-related protein 1 n=1 Tax=Rhipicephalus sanguineus TaxID=34632 RepID=UPI0018951537|nr:feline leukemia virus subgroup C receptor-related protein 1 [Rhipicephalus sanguineus]